MAGYGPPPGPYAGFQPNVQPIGFELHHQGYPPSDNSPGYPPPPSQDMYYPTRNEYSSYANPSPAMPTTPVYHKHGDENGDNLPPVGFEGIAAPKDQDTATTSGVTLSDRESPVPPILKQPSHGESRMGPKSPQVFIKVI